MPTYYARKAGNINATDVWATTPSGTAGAQTFAAGDILVANSFTITVNVTTDLGNGTVTNDNRDGAVAGGSFSLANGVTLTANVVAGGTSTSCVTTASAVAATIVGSITAGSATTAYGVFHNSSGQLTVTGNATGGGGTGASGIGVNSTGGLTLTGNVTGGTAPSARGVHVLANANATITGTVSGGSQGPGMQVDGSGTITVVGTCVGGGGAGLNIAGGSTSTVTRAKGGPNMGSAVGVIGPISGSGAVSVDEIEYGDLGASPVSGSIRFSDKPTNVAIMYRFGTTKKTLVDANASGLMPAASNVRSGVVYNGGNSTGTMAVPAAGSVALGVPVDNTTGTAALTPAAVWDYATASATTAGSMGERLANAATVASTGQQIADAVTA